MTFDLAGRPSGSRWFGVGHSTATDPDEAASAAVLDATGGREASLLLVFCSNTYDLRQLLDAIRRQAGGAAIAGCTSMGQLVAPQPTDGSVAVVALGGPGFEVRTRTSLAASAGRREAGMAVAGCVADLDRPHRAMLLLCDGLAGEHHEIVRGAHAAAGAGVPLVGGCAADQLEYHRTYQFHGDANGVDVLTDAVIGIAVGSDAPIGIGIAHGWRKQGEGLVATSSSSGGCLHELDEKPALDVYLSRIGADRSLAEDTSKFREVALGKPLGMSRRSCEDIRVIHDADLSQGSVICLADVPQGALIWLMETDTEALITAAAESSEQAVAGLGGEQPMGAIVFDCGARKVMLGPDGIAREATAFARALGGAPFAGFYTYGEIARTEGSRGMHHLTFVTLVFA